MSTTKGIAGIERYLDESIGVEPVHGATLTDRPPVRLSLDLGVQHALEDELADATKRYRARGAAGHPGCRERRGAAAASLPLSIRRARPKCSTRPDPTA